MKRLLAWAGAGLLLVALLLVAGAYWLLGTSPGAHWLLARGDAAWQGRLAAGQVSGNFRHGLVIRDARIEGDGFSLTIREARLSGSVGIAPPVIRLADLQAEGVTFAWTPSAGDSLPLRERLPRLVMPVPLEIGAASIREVTILRDGDILLENAAVTASGRWGDALENLALQVDSDYGTARLTGGLALTGALGFTLDGNWRDPGRRLQVDGLDFRIAGDSDHAELRADATDVAVTLQADLGDPLGDVSFTAQLSANDWSLGENARLARGQAQLHGTPTDYELSATAEAELAGLGAVTASTQGRGDSTGLLLASLGVVSPALEADAHGHVDWASPGTLVLVSDRLEMRPETWWPDWPAANPVSGNARIEWSPGRLLTGEVDLVVAGSGARVSGIANWDEAAAAAQARLEWMSLAWPPAATAPSITSAQGEAVLAGTPDAWTLEGEALVATPGFPGGSLRFTGAGGRTQVQLDRLDATLLGGSAAGSARLDWGASPQWRAELELRGIDLAVLAPRWPARLDAHARLAGEPGQDRWQADITSLTAQLAEGRLQGSGSVRREGIHWWFDHFSLDGPGSRLALDGSWDGPQGLGFDLDIGAGSLLAEVIGLPVAGRGRVVLAGNEAPLLAGHLTGGPARFGDLGFAGFALEAVVDSGVQLQVNGLEWQTARLGDARLDLQGSLAQHRLTARVDLHDHPLARQVDLGLEGGLVHWNDPARRQWRGHLAKLELADATGVRLALETTATVEFGPRRARLDRACFHPGGPGRLCGEAGWSSADGWRLKGDLADWPLGGWPLPVPEGIRFTQALRGGFGWSQAPGHMPSGHADLELTAGHYGPADDPELRVHTGPGRFGFAMQGGQLRAGRLQVGFDGRGEVGIDWGIDNVALDGSGQLFGRARVQALDLSVLESLWPQLDRVGGMLDADLALGGRIGDPQFDGTFSLRGAAVGWSLLGVEVRELAVQGRVSTSDRLQFEGQFRMGEGAGRLGGWLDFADPAAPRWEVALSGQRLRIADLPTLRADADPDLKLAWHDGDWHVSGTLAVPSALLAPSGAVFSRVSESPDVQVVAGELPALETQPLATEVNLEGQLKVSLGEDVRLSMQQVEAALGGEVTLYWPRTLVPNAEGRILVNGEVRVFGPLLHIYNGRVRFTGGPVDNPQLNLRAVRDVYGNTQIQTTGVLVSGNAKQPVVEAFTVPLTTRERAWALLLTGQDFEYGQGVGAFDIGTYIAPRLYVSYGVSLFDDTNVVSARYDLRRGFGIKATSSQTENGLDISYTLTRGKEAAGTEGDSGGETP